MAKISVIIPVYKVEQYLNRCVESILNQTFSDFELILVDDGSPDNCPKMCDDFALKDKRVKVIHKTNGGLSDARNAGLDYAFSTDSEYVTFVDSDDWIHNQYLEILYNKAIENNVEISSCAVTRTNEYKQDIVFSEIKTTVDTAEILYSSNFEYDVFNIANSWARLYKKQLWKDVRFPFGRLHEDELTTYKVLFAVDKIVLIQEPLYYYYQNSTGIMHSDFTAKRIEDNLLGQKEQSLFSVINNFNFIEKSLDNYYYLMLRLNNSFLFDFKKTKAIKKNKKELNKIINLLDKEKNYELYHKYSVLIKNIRVGGFAKIFGDLKLKLKSFLKRMIRHGKN